MSNHSEHSKSETSSVHSEDVDDSKSEASSHSTHSSNSQASGSVSSKSGSGSGSETGSGSASESGSETGSETGSASESGSETGSETGSESASESGSEIATETETESESENEKETKDKSVKSVGRPQIVKELASSEATYVANLEAFCDVFVFPLKNATKTTSAERKILNRQEIRCVFNDIDKILKVSKDILKKLQEKAKDFDDNETRVSDVFTLSRDFNEAHSKYVSLFDACLKSLSKHLKYNKQFIEFYKINSKDAKLQGHDPLYFLTLPIQRFLEYSDTLHSLFTKTPLTHPDYQGLKGSISILRAARSDNQDKMQDLEGIQGMIEISKKVKGAPSSIVDPSRRFLKKYEVTEIINSGIQDRVLLVFNDMIIVTYVSGDSLQYRSTIDLTLVMISLQKDQGGNKNLFQLELPGSKILYSASSVEQRREIVGSLEGLLKKLTAWVQSGYVLKGDISRKIIFDTGLQDATLAEEVNYRTNKVIVVNCGGKGRENWPSGVEVIETDLSNSDYTSRLCMGANTIYCPLIDPFDKHPQFVHKAVASCLEYPENLFTTAYGKLKDAGKIYEVFILDRKS